MGDRAVALLSLVAILAIGPALLVEHLEKSGWVPEGFSGIHVREDLEGWRAWRWVRCIGQAVYERSLLLKIVAFVAATSAAAVQLGRTL